MIDISAESLQTLRAAAYAFRLGRICCLLPDFLGKPESPWWKENKRLAAVEQDFEKVFVAIDYLASQDTKVQATTKNLRERAAKWCQEIRSLQASPQPVMTQAEENGTQMSRDSDQGDFIDRYAEEWFELVLRWETQYHY